MAYKIFLGNIASLLATEKEKYNDKINEISLLNRILSIYENTLSIVTNAQDILELADNAAIRYNNYYYIFENSKYTTLMSLKLQFNDLRSDLRDRLTSPDYDDKTIIEWANDNCDNIKTDIHNAEVEAQSHLVNIKNIIGEIGDDVELKTNNITTIKSLANQLSRTMDNIQDELDNIL